MAVLDAENSYHDRRNKLHAYASYSLCIANTTFNEQLTAHIRYTREILKSLARSTQETTMLGFFIPDARDFAVQEVQDLSGSCQCLLM